MIPKAYTYKGLNTVKVDDEAIKSLKSSASGKAKARYVHEPSDPCHDSSTAGSGVKRRAYTPGGPAGS
jgi:hypothetical protein